MVDHADPGFSRLEADESERLQTPSARAVTLLFEGRGHEDFEDGRAFGYHQPFIARAGIGGKSELDRLANVDCDCITLVGFGDADVLGGRCFAGGESDRGEE